MRLLDLFCGAGGAGMGYHRAGFEVVGVDIKPQPHFPFEFHQGDALEYLAEHGHEFDAIHASPPCQGYSVTRHIHGYEYPLLIEETRELLLATGKPYVIENVMGAPMNNPTILDGRMFGLRVIRRRQFETNWFLLAPAPAQVTVYTHSSKGYSAHRNGATHITVAGHNYDFEDGKAAMKIDWMTKDELAEAIPPAYTEFIGRALMRQLTERVAFVGEEANP
jgi:DNA (cytosine-5)-methyltransferase 1